MMKKATILILTLLLWVVCSFGQTTLIAPTGDGGFENGATFADNGWTLVNGTATATQNQWYLGTSGTAGIGAGNVAYITNNIATGAYSYTNNTPMYIVHFYKDVTFPAGETLILLSFTWKGVGETTAYDGLQVSVAPTTVTPTAASTAPTGTVTTNIVTGATLVGNTLYYNQSTGVTANISIPASVAGNGVSNSTMRLIFTFRMDGSVGTSPATAIDQISLTSAFPPPPLTGVKTINPTGSGSNNYTSFTSAINALNIAGTGTGGVVFNVKDDAVFTEDCPALVATGTIDNPIIFQRDNSGTSTPVIKPTGSSATSDFGIRLSGCDFITFDGIDITISTGSAVEYGFYFIGTATDGCKNNTIKNCNVTLNKSNTSSRGIYMISVASAVGGSNSGNRFLNNMIQNVYNGIYLTGSSSSLDDSNEINVLSGGTSTITNIGGLSTGAYGIYIGYQTNLTVANTSISSVTGSSTVVGIYESLGANTINYYGNSVFNITGTSTSSGVYGMWITTGTTHNIYSNQVYSISAPYNVYGISISSGTTNHIYKNMVYDINYSGSSSYIAYGLSVSGGTTNNVYNNYIYNIRAAAGTTGNPSVRAINLSGGTTDNIYFNTVYLDYTAAHASNQSAALYATTGPTTIDLRNNIIINNTNVTTGTRAVAFYRTSTALTNLATTCNNNLFYAGTPGSKNLIYYDGTNSDQLFTAFQTRLAPRESNSVTENPPFASAVMPYNFHLQTTIPTRCESGGSAITTPISVTDDYDGESRQPIPDIGADEFPGTPYGAINPSAFAASVISGTQINLTFIPNVSNNDVLIIWNGTGSFTDPTGIPPAVGSDFAGGKVLYLGTSSPVIHSGLTINTPYYYRAFSFDGANYSSGASANATPNVAAPATFTATSMSTSEIDLLWTKNVLNHNVIIAVNSTNTFGNPVNGTTYSIDDVLADGGTIIYTGSANGFNHTGLSAATTYYYKVWSVDELAYYSLTGLTANATTFCETFTLPFTENFTGLANGAMPNCWSKTTIGSTNWGAYASANAGGTSPEMRFYFSPAFTDTSMLISPIINTSGQTSVKLEFKHMVDWYANPFTVGVKTSSDGINWHTVWSISPTANVLAETKSITINNSDVGSSNFQFAFFFKGYSFNIDYWYIDNVSLASMASGTLEGYVYKFGTSTPISGATVAAGTFNATTNESGFYQINNILTGTYSVTASASGYIPETINGVTISTGLTTTTNFNLTWANISVNPVSISQTLAPGGSGSQNLTIFNTGGTAPLTWSAAIVEPQAWISIDPSSGTVDPNSSVITTVNFNATGVTEGTYNTNIVITHNGQNPTDETLTVPVTLIVSATQAPEAPSVPNPANNATSVSIQPLLSWTNGARTNEVKVIISKGIASVYTSPYFIGNSLDLSTIPLTLLTNSIYKWRVEAKNSAGSILGPQWQFTTETCPPPNTLTVADVTGDQATLGWTEAGTATSWDIEYGVAPFTPTGTPSISSVTNPYNLTGLLALTNYVYYVRANCGGSDFSSWAGPKAFSTGCGSLTEFSQNFDALTPPALPQCWSKIGTEGSASTQTTGNYSSPNCLYIYAASGTYGATVAMISLSNLGANTHQLKFKLRANFTAGGVVQVGYMTDPAIPASFVLLQSFTTTSTTVYQDAVVIPGTAPGSSTTLAFRQPPTPGYSVLIDNVTWEPLPACPDPTALTATGIAGHSAVLGWTQGGTAASWDIEYGPTPFTPTGVPSITGVTNPYTLTGLVPTTSYAFYVRANCGTNGYSAWSGPKTFTTTVSCPAPTTLTTTDITINSATLGWTETGVATSWDVEYGATPFTPTGTPTLSGVTNPLVLNGLTAATGYAFYVRANCGTGDLSTWAGPKTFTTAVSCPAPTTLTATSVTTTSATLGWTETGTATTWDVEYGITPFTPTGTPTLTGVSNPQIINGLISSTGYAFYVRANCGTGDLSTWSGPKTFNTTCETMSIPYLENFESATVPAIPVCTSTQNLGSGNNWVTVSNPGYGFTSKTLKYSYSTLYPANTWFYTNGVNLSTGTSYRLTFRYGNNSTTFVEKLKVAYGTAAINTAMTNVLLDFPNITGGVAQNASIDFTPATSEVFYFGFLAYSIEDQYYLFVDDISIELTPTCPKPVTLTAVPSAFSAVLGWTESGSATSWDIEYGPTPFTPTGTPTLTGVTNPVTISSLLSATGYAFYVRSNCGNGDLSTWAGPKTFTTTISCPAPTSLTATDITFNSAVLGWTEAGTATSWDIEYGATPFTPTGTPTLTGVTNPQTITGLTGSTGYAFYVRANCGIGDLSTWSGPKTFNTACEAFGVPFTEGFEGSVFPPTCWSNQSWTSSTYGTAHTGTKWAYSNLIGSKLTTPEISIPATNGYRFSFWYKAESATYPQAFDVLISTDGGLNWVVLQNFTGVTSTTYLQAVYSLEAYSGQNVWIRFVGQYGTGGLAYGVCVDDILIEMIPPPEQTINIPAGWSGWSSYIDPATVASFGDVVVPVAANMIFSQYFSNIYWPAYNINTMGAFSNDHGYISKMTSESLLTLTGTKLAPGTINLASGWNLISVLSTCNVDATLLNTIPGFVICMEVAGAGVYWPSGGISSLSTLVPGKAYWVKMSSAGSFTFPACAKDAGATVQLPLRPEYSSPWNTVTYTGSSHFISITEEAMANVKHGDVLGVFLPEGVCAGMVQLEGATTLNAYGDDISTSVKDGFADGDGMTFKVYRPSTGELFDVTIDYNTEMPEYSGAFTALGMSQITGMTLKSTGIISQNDMQISIYPNPSNGIFQLSLNGIEDEVEMMVIDVHGQIVVSGSVIDNARIDLSNQPKGIYYVKLVGNNFTSMEKIVVK